MKTRNYRLDNSNSANSDLLEATNPIIVQLREFRWFRVKGEGKVTHSDHVIGKDTSRDVIVGDSDMAPIFAEFAETDVYKDLADKNNIDEVKKEFIKFIKQTARESFADEDLRSLETNLNLGDTIFQCSPEFTVLSDAQRRDPNLVETALKAFLKRTILKLLSDDAFNEKFDSLCATYSQQTWKEFHDAMTASASYIVQDPRVDRHDYAVVTPRHSIKVIFFDNNTFHVYTRLSDIEFKRGKDGNETRINLPGSIASTFNLEERVKPDSSRDRQFKFVYVRPSNALMRDMCFNKSVDVEKRLADAEVNVNILIEKSEVYKSQLRRDIIKDHPDLETLEMPGEVIYNEEQKAQTSPPEKLIDYLIKNEGTHHEKDLSEQTRDGLKKIRALEQLQQILQMPNRNALQKLDAFEDKMLEVKPILEKRRDTNTTTFFKIVASILPIFIPWVWAVRGKDFIKDAQKQTLLGRHRTRHDLPELDARIDAENLRRSQRRPVK